MKQLSSVVKKWAAEWRKTHSVTAIISPNFPPGGTCLITGQGGKAQAEREGHSKRREGSVNKCGTAKVTGT